MIPIDQGGPSDCLRACLASILEVTLLDVVDTTPPADDDHWSQHNIVVEWLRPLGLTTWELHPPTVKRGVIIHEDGTREPAVVMRSGKIVHDPHPARDMTIDRITGITVLVRSPA